MYILDGILIFVEYQKIFIWKISLYAIHDGWEEVNSSCSRITNLALSSNASTSNTILTKFEIFIWICLTKSDKNFFWTYSGFYMKNAIYDIFLVAYFLRWKRFSPKYRFLGKKLIRPMIYLRFSTLFSSLNFNVARCICILSIRRFYVFGKNFYCSKISLKGTHHTVGISIGELNPATDSFLVKLS